MFTLRHLFTCLVGCFLAVPPLFAQQTEVKFLSGTGKDDTVNWEFQCTRGRNSGTWTTIPVPSNWELQGFGTYHYGNSKEDSLEAGLYRHSFTMPANWQQKRIFIVFDGSMTDTEVKINGQLAGPVHQGGFYQFRYDITPLVKMGQPNQLEVRVNKLSANRSVNEAERGADFWVFGGIFRPVSLEAFPQQYIARTAIDAKADGSFTMNVFTAGIRTAGTVEARIVDQRGQAVGQPMTATVQPGDSVVQVRGKVVKPAPWSPEFPTMYRVNVTLKAKTATLHTLTEKFGFRTVELRERDGIYVNGQRMMFRGVNRGTFWPTTGRTTNRQLSILDVNLIKDMNMNAVRMSHYPPDKHFLETCDSLGLFVIDELTGWQYPPYDTQVGRKLVKELIVRDVNHPSIILWANGNEGGFNFDLVPDYPKYDIQKRPVIHPWLNRYGTNTKHYIYYNYGLNTFFNGHDVFFPTEVLHGLYDGGHGAGLDDYWNLMRASPLSAGGFLWDFCDQGIVRTDKGAGDRDAGSGTHGPPDTNGNSGADGIVGPYREKEASFYTIKEIWSPVFFPKKFITPQFDGQLPVENRYYLTNLNRCTFRWKLKKFSSLALADTTSVTGSLTAPDVKPMTNGVLTVPLPANWAQYDVLYVTGRDPYGRELYTWSWPITLPDQMAARFVETGTGTITATDDNSRLTLTANGLTVGWDKKTGMIGNIKNRKNALSFANGPVLIGGDDVLKTFTHRDTLGTHVIELTFEGKHRYRATWTMYPSGWLKLTFQYRPDNMMDMLGVTFDYPEDQVTGMDLLANGPYRVWRNRLKGGTLNEWHKTYNDAITGERWEYPEFKGYYSNFYGARLLTKEGGFTVLSGSEGLFLRVLTPTTPKGAPNNPNTAPAFPTGGISFMNGITAIGTKFQKAETMGPQSEPNQMYANGGTDTEPGVLYFDFR